jgi:hypothetical protein
MQEYEIIRVGGLIEKERESSYHQLVADFSCPLNNDLEHFLKNTAIENQKKNISRTNLVYASFEKQKVLVGYYSVAIQVLTLEDDISKSIRKKITGFTDLHKNNVPVFLIGQMGKNFYNGYNKLISGEELFAQAIIDIKEAQKLVGGRVVMIECKNDEKLKHFYNNALGLRQIEHDQENDLLTYVAKISNFQV